ncbi:MAG: glycosyltransferase [Bacilli bacterium]|nr:glycosyltransferase [Bacilli bacterium]
MKVSIIIPAYNVENYIDKCLNSLVKQSLKDIEIIVVNDGSTDNTQKVIDKYAKKYSNVIALEKENGGVSEARNLGLKKATGKYIGFLDSDDWIDKDMYKKLYQKAISEDFDIVACDTEAIFPDKKQYISSNIKNDFVSNKELMIDAYAVIWNKIYKKDLIKEITFKKGMNFCEDVEFLYMVYSKAKKIGVIHEPLHNYLQREGSLTYVYDKKLYKLIEAMDDIIEYYKKNEIFDEYKEELEYTYVRYLYATFIKRMAKTKNKLEFNKAVNTVIEKVTKEFPNYKKNHYLKGLNPKNLYLKYFNKTLSKIIYEISSREKFN